MTDICKAAEKYIRPGAIVNVDVKTTAILVDLLRQALAQPEWVGLTDDEISEIWGRLPQTRNEEHDAIVFGCAIEAKLKEKNT